MFTVFLLLREPRIQTLLVRTASDYLSRELQTEIRVGGLSISIFNGLIIEGISIKDRQNARILYAKNISVLPGRFSMQQRYLHIRQVRLDEGEVQLLTHKGDSSLSFQFIIDYFTSTTVVTEEPDTVKGNKWSISVDAIQLSDTRFHLQDLNEPLSDTGMDYSNIDISHINMLLTDFKPDQDTLHAKIKYLSAVERSGLQLQSLTGEFSFSPIFIKAKELRIKTEKSDLFLDLEFRYDSLVAFNDFLNKVTIHADLNPCVLNLEEIGHFAPEMYDMKDVVYFAGNAKGTVANFRLRDFRLFYGTGTRFSGNVTATGLPNVEETFVDMNIKNFTTNQEDIQSFRLPAGGGNIILPDVLKNTGDIRLKGLFTGFYNDFVANARLSTGIGSLTTDLTLRTKKGSPEISYIGQANAQHLALGRLLGVEELGFVTFRADLNGKGLKFDKVDLEANLIIDSLDFNNYTYQNIAIRGALQEKQFNGSLRVIDPNLDLSFNGLIDFSDSIPEFDFTSRIRKAQLFTLNFLKRDSLMDLSMLIKVNIRGNSLDNMEGIIRVDSTWYMEGIHVIPLMRLSLLTSTDGNNNKSYHLVSDYVNADISGNFSFSSIIPSLSNFITNYLASFSMQNQEQLAVISGNQRLNYKINFRNTDPLTEVFTPFLRIAPKTILQGEYNEQTQVIDLNGRADYLSIYGMDLRNWYIHATSRQENLSVLTGCEKFEMKKEDETDTLTIIMDSLQLVSDIREDTIHYDLSWTSSDSLSRLGGFVTFSTSPAIEMKMLNFNVMVDGGYWRISPDNYVIFDSSATIFNDFSFLSGDQYFRINGRISSNPSDTLYAEFNDVDVSNVDYFIGNPDINLDGILSGKLKINNIFSNMNVLADIDLEKFAFNKELLGDAFFRILYDAEQDKFDVKSEIVYHGNAGESTPFRLEGSYFMGGKDPHMDFNMDLKNLNLKMVSPFVSSFMTGVKGYASGNVSITGKPDEPVFKGKINLMRSEFRISYLNVPYSLADTIDIEEGYFGFNDITLFDSLGNRAILNGRITHNHLKDIRLDLKVNFSNFSAFQNTYAQNNLFYGTAAGTGNVVIAGPLNDIYIGVKAQNTEGTHVIIPISTTAAVGENDYIIFEKLKDTLSSPFTLAPEETSTNISLDLSLQVNPTAILEVFFPDQLGSINAKGSGALRMSMTPYSDFLLSGIYTIQKGTFLFQLRNLMRYSFAIREGSYISWAGDPTDANISMSAVYKSRVPLEGLTTNTDLKSVRVPVETVIHLTGKLMNPDIAVSLDLPNVDEELKSLVYSSIDTNNASEMTQQMINILVFNQFKSIQGANTGNIDVGNTSLSLLTNMANSFTSRFSKNVSIGFNYSRSTYSAGQEFDVAISTQVFNERLHIDGLFGMNSMNPNSTAQGASQIVGDINIAYDLTRNRRWQLRGFNRTNAYDNLNLNNAPYTQGFGISYKKDFNRWCDLFKSDKKEKKQ